MKPSDFAKMGFPCCSCWCKFEPELIALAYVWALEATGDTWRRMTADEVLYSLTEEQKDYMSAHGLITGRLFDPVADLLSSEEGARQVGGGWHMREKCTSTTQS